MLDWGLLTIVWHENTDAIVFGIWEDFAELCKVDLSQALWLDKGVTLGRELLSL